MSRPRRRLADRVAELEAKLAAPTEIEPTSVGTAVPRAVQPAPAEPRPRRRRRQLTDKMVAALPRKAKRYIIGDPEMRGHFVRVPVRGPAVYAAVARSPYGRQTWATIGTADVLAIAEARDRAREAILRIKEGKPAFEPAPVQPETVAAVVANWLRRHVDENGVRTADQIRRIVETHVLPRWREREFTTIKRSDVAALLDAVEDGHGKWTADAVLTVLRSVAGWYIDRADDYVSPFHKIKQRVPREKRTRARILADDELRAVWRTAEASRTFGALVRLALLCAQRREKLSTMKWDDVSPDGVWTIPSEAREKSHAGELQLPQQALDILAALPRFAGNPYVFASVRGKGPLRGFSSMKPEFDRRCGVTGWSIHDLRRSARSLMSRAGVLSEHAERVLGHTKGGVEGVYDRHVYFEEKAHALRQLAALVERIVHPPDDAVVVPMRPQVGQQS